MTTSDQTSFCPDCNSPLVDFSVLADEGARCNACGWSGRKSEMLSAPFSHEMGDPDEVMKHFVGDLRTTLAKSFALPFGMFLQKWGFLPDEKKEKAVVLTRYITAVARAAVKVVFEERANIEKERVNATSGRPA